ncbi:MAG: carbohydrate-binding protein [Paludibacteraceae bacterium]|nr:carbohydrate-binding protein [Paludibacteraceae bacterium]
MKNLSSFAILSMVLMLSMTACEKNNPDDPTNEPIVDSNDYAYIQAKSPKRGVSFSWQLDADFDLLGPVVSWSYNWANTYAPQQEGKYQQYGIHFVPMCWNNNYNADAIAAYYASHTEKQNYLLGYNEPNLTDQANMTPTQAAEHWADVVAVAKNSNARLISPAMNWGTLAGYSNGVQWLQEFFTKVNPNDIYGIAVHIYMNSAKAALGDLQRYKVFGKPLWLTEFCAWEGVSTSAAQIQFLTQAINALEQDPGLERYAWFIPRGGYTTEAAPFMSLLTKTNPPTLTERGVVFVNMSSFDKNAVYPCGKRIPAEHYRACSVDENYSSPLIAICTDASGILQIDGLALNQWMDYKVQVVKAVKHFQIRYAATRDSQITIYRVDDNGNETPLQAVNLPTTGGKSNWTTLSVDFTPEAGIQVLRLKCTDGLPRINWFKLN